MKVMHSIAEFRSWRRDVTRGGGAPFVPTMGALHEGHVSLVRTARERAAGGVVMASIFVNPTQFGPKEDFAKYPRTLDSDLRMLEGAGCDAVFVPAVEEMYGKTQNRKHETQTADVKVDPGPLGEVLEGAIRPGHFRGVCTVVAKLLHIVEPTELLLGQKDFQQQLILRRMCRDLNMGVEVVTCPTVREVDGLAMSSRNRYLSAEERVRAGQIFAALREAWSALAAGERRAERLEMRMRSQLEKAGLEVQYAIVANEETLASWDRQEEVTNGAVLLVAVKCGATRLIDNLPLGDAMA